MHGQAIDAANGFIGALIQCVLMFEHIAFVELAKPIERRAKSDRLQDWRRAGFELVRGFIVGDAVARRFRSSRRRPGTAAGAPMRLGFAIQRTDPGRPVNLVPCQHVIIAAERLHIDVEMNAG